MQGLLAALWSVCRADWKQSKMPYEANSAQKILEHGQVRWQLRAHVRSTTTTSKCLSWLILLLELSGVSLQIDLTVLNPLAPVSVPAGATARLRLECR